MSLECRGDEIEDSLQAEQDFLLMKQNFVQIREVKPVFQEYYIFESQWDIYKQRSIIAPGM